MRADDHSTGRNFSPGFHERRNGLKLPQIGNDQKRPALDRCRIRTGGLREAAKLGSDRVIRSLCRRTLDRSDQRKKYLRDSTMRTGKDSLTVDRASKQWVGLFIRPPKEFVWLSTVRAVVLTMTAYTAMARFLKDTGQATVGGLMREFREGAEMAKTMSFNVKAYRREDRGVVPQRCIDALTKPYEFRGQNDLKLVYSMIVEMQSLRTKYPDRMLWKLARYLRYYRCAAKKILTRENRTPILVYFLYSGDARIVHEPEHDRDYSSVRRHEGIRLNQGACLGAAKKTRFCVCITECEFLTIDKRVFAAEGFVRAVQIELDEKVDFFSSWPPIEHWSDNAFRDLARASFVDNYSGGTMIMFSRLESVADLAYFVVDGLVDVIKVVQGPILAGRSKNQSSVVECRARLAARTTTTTTTRTTTTTADERFDSNEAKPYKLDSNSRTPLYVRVRTLTKGDCFGLGKMNVAGLPRESGRFSLVSRNSTVIRTPRRELEKLLEILGVDLRRLAEASPPLPTDEAIEQRIREIRAGERESKRLIKKFLPKIHKYVVPRDHPTKRPAKNCRSFRADEEDFKWSHLRRDAGL